MKLSCLGVYFSLWLFQYSLKGLNFFFSAKALRVLFAGTAVSLRFLAGHPRFFGQVTVFISSVTSGASLTARPHFLATFSNFRDS